MKIEPKGLQRTHNGTRTWTSRRREERRTNVSNTAITACADEVQQARAAADLTRDAATAACSEECALEGIAMAESQRHHPLPASSYPSLRYSARSRSSVPHCTASPRLPPWQFDRFTLVIVHYSTRPRDTRKNATDTTPIVQVSEMTAHADTRECAADAGRRTQHSEDTLCTRSRRHVNVMQAGSTHPCVECAALYARSFVLAIMSVEDDACTRRCVRSMHIERCGHQSCLAAIFAHA